MFCPYKDIKSVRINQVTVLKSWQLTARQYSFVNVTWRPPVRTYVRAGSSRPWTCPGASQVWRSFCQSR